MLPQIRTRFPHHSINVLRGLLSSGDLAGARRLFDKIPQPYLHPLTLLISAYTKQGLPGESIRLYWELRREKNLQPDRLVLLAVAKACAASSDLMKAKKINEDVVRFGFGSDLLLGNVMIDMYGKCGFSEGAKRVFDGITNKDVISWTSLIAAYVNCGMREDGIIVFNNMLRSGTKPNSVTISTVLIACSKLKALNCGKEIHCYVLRNGLEADNFVNCGLVDMYANCSSIRQARIIFDKMPRRDAACWSAILSTYFLCGDSEEALSIFNRMKTEGCVMGSASWNCMISGFAQNGKTEQAFEMFTQMQDLGIEPNHITITSLLPACADLENLRAGREVHAYVYRKRLTDVMTITTALVLMYAKCGDLDKSQRVFDEMPIKDTIAWNTMILANSMHGCGKEALLLYKQMKKLGLKPNPVTFMVVLIGCSHSQLVDEGRSIFRSMSRDHSLEPTADHYACMVDILSRAGHLKEAYEFVQRMPMEPTVSAWGALLASCRVYKNVELARIAAKHLLELEPENHGSYVLLSNILVAAKLWEDASKVRVMMRNRGISKVPGYSWVQIKNKVYTFVKGDDKNAQRDEIYSFLEEIGQKMRLEGYRPDTNYVLQDVGREEKEEVLCSHSEKLAVAFGLLNRNGESSIRIFKNLRICGDCHNAIKYMSKIMRIQIIVRDNLRFHHFNGGSCSCQDKW